jgi:periplasmic protein TonB
MRRRVDAPTMAPAVSEIEIAVADPPKPPPPPPVESVATQNVAGPVARAAAPARVAPRVSPPPPVITAKGDALPGDPVSFATDANGAAFEHGAVGAAPAVTSASVSAPIPTTKPVPGPVEALAPPAMVAQPPRLNDPNACRGYFPTDAESDAAVVALTVIVRGSGDVSTVRVLSESPAGQGFGSAARRCLLVHKFSPALDGDGRAVSAAANVNLRFSR